MFRLLENKSYQYEDDLVKAFIEKFKDQELNFGNDWVKGEFFEQVRVPEIGRISDLVVCCGERRLINIEFKLGDYACLENQCIDHLKWADYSYACVPINWLRIYPQSFCESLLRRGIGLIVGSKDTFIEVFRAKHNTYKAGKSKELRTKVYRTIKPLKPITLFD